MTDMHDPHQVAQRAKEFLDDAVTQEIFRRMEDRAVSNWRNSPADNPAQREAAYAEIKAVENLKVHLNSLAIAPRVAEANTRAKQRGTGPVLSSPAPKDVQANQPKLL